MFSVNKNVESIQKLLLELKNYYLLQKKFIRLDTAEKLTVILSAIGIALIILILVSFICFFGTLAFAFYLGNVLNNVPLGFIIVAGIMTLALLIFYLNRKKFVVEPLARFIGRLFIQEQNTENHGTESPNAEQQNVHP